ncbi:MAG: leucine-rich repeat protein [Clostridiales bacterium]|jgi:hypothetical protein|nr:leucine-rich repeat protein [Clostridiales bacterium]
MKKLKTLLLMLAVVLAALALAACGAPGGDPPDNGGAATPAALPAPTLNIGESEKLLTWNAVANASGYSVRVGNGTPIDNGALTSYSLASLTAACTYSLKVMAKGDGANYTDSPWSAAKTYTVADVGGPNPQPAKVDAPTNLQIDAETKTLTWDAVPNASGYSVRADNGTPIDNGASTSYSLAPLTAAGTYSLKVMAKGDGGAFLDSDWSNAVTYRVTQGLAAPVNLQINAETKTLTWDAVPNASGYSVRVDNGTPIDNGASTSYSLASLAAAYAHALKVMAKGDGGVFLDSDWSVEAVCERQETPGLQFTLINEGAEYSVSKGTAMDAETLIPSIHEGKPVTAIAPEGFKNYAGFTSLTIPAGVASIGASAFYGCKNLTVINFNATASDDLSRDSCVFDNAGTSGMGITVNVGANVTKIPAYLFYPYTNSAAPKIVTVNFAPNGVCQSIGASAFYACGGLTGITIPSGVTSIGASAFYDCNGLTNIKMPDGLQSIGAGAFYGCYGLTSITVPDSVRSIGKSAFTGSSLATV